MSVADEFPPEVWIPAQARPRRASLSLVPCGPVDDAAVETSPLASPAADRGHFIRPVLAPDGVVTLAPPVRTEVAPVRLTMRGKVVLAVLAGVVALLVLVVAHASAGGSAAARPVPTAVTVQAGDTLWSIATEIAPSVDPRITVDHLVQVNHLTGAVVRPGQVLQTR